MHVIDTHTHSQLCRHLLHACMGRIGIYCVHASHCACVHVSVVYHIYIHVYIHPYHIYMHPPRAFDCAWYAHLDVPTLLCLCVRVCLFGFVVQKMAGERDRERDGW